MAAELSYTTLLSLVPLMTVAFSLLAAFPVFQGLVKDIQDFLFSHFVPAFGKELERHLFQFMEQAKRLTAVGILFLVFTALLLMFSIERSLNDIWRVKRRRTALASFLVYWTVLTLGPLLIGASLTVTLPLFAHPGSLGITGPLVKLMPFLSATLAFFFLYTIVPNRSIPVGHALAGAFIAALLFNFANQAFALYVTHFPAYQLIYGALAAVPVFLVWIYISWVVILLGAEITYGLMTFRPTEGGRLEVHRGQELRFAFRLIGHLWQAQRRGEALSLRRLLRLEPHLHELILEVLLEDLEARHMVQRTASGDWILARDVSTLTLLELYRSLPYRLPREEACEVKDGWDRIFKERLKEVETCLERTLNVPLKALYQGPP